MKSLFVVFMVQLVCSISIAQVINAGVGGNSTSNLLDRLKTDVLQQHPDLVILMVGTNDLLNSKKMITFGKYKSNLIQLVKAFEKNNIKLLLITSPPVDSIHLFERHPRNLLKLDPNEKLDSARKIVISIANENEVKYLDLFQVFSEMNLPKHNQDLFFKNPRNSGSKDGVHPTALGYRFIGELVFRYLKDLDYLKENQKIVCFGDSITKGNGVEGSGTAIGETYPAVLQKFILESKK